MVDFIVKYWIEFLFTGVVAILTIFGKYFHNLLKDGIHVKEEKAYIKIKNKLSNEESVKNLKGVVKENRRNIAELSKIATTNKETIGKLEKVSTTNRSAIEELKGVATTNIDAINELKDIVNVNTDFITKMATTAEINQKGILSILKKGFVENCQKFLDDDYDITLEEYNSLSRDYDVYKSLGGNCEGDRLFMLVQKKVEKDL